jgi:hypothetical protein
MGCDIHMYIEKREGEHWRFVTRTDLGIPDKPDREDDDEGWDGYFDAMKRWREETGLDWNVRNYRTFQLLANVRNWPIQSVPPISKPRGVPDDASPEYRAEVEYWDSDGHSHSYFTIAELRTALDDHPVRQRAVFFDAKWPYLEQHPEAADADPATIPGELTRIRAYVAEHGKPPDDAYGELGLQWWCDAACRMPDGSVVYAAGTVPPRVYHDGPRASAFAPDGEMRWECVSAEEAERRGIQPQFAWIEWKQPYRDLMPTSFCRLLDYIEEKVGADPADIRLVFFFDN